MAGTHKKQWLHIMIILIFISLSFYACNPKSTPSLTLPADTNIDINPLFREFYKDLGGEKYLGKAISPIFGKDGSNCQYTVNVMICHDPKASGMSRFYLAPLGNQLNYHDQPQNFPEDQPGLILDGYAIHPDFIAAYRDLRGALNVGRPLTQIRYNDEQQRVEQYFERVGFYRKYEEPPGVVHLLPYGSHLCKNNCKLPENAINGRDEINTPFEDLLNPIGGEDTFGKPLSQAYVVDEDKLQQVYKNVVVFASKDDPSTIHFQPISIILEMEQMPPGSQVYGEDQQMKFYEVDGDLGYHIPLVFTQFIDNHGGMALAGKPIAEPMMVNEENIARQCFENYCIDYHTTSDADSPVRLAPLGDDYLEFVNFENIVPYALSEDALMLQVGELKAQVSSDETQTIYYVVINKENEQPIPNIEAKIRLTMPDGRSMDYFTPPTDVNGISYMVVPAMNGVENGSLIVYKICLDVPSEDKICASDTYLIWDLR